MSTGRSSDIQKFAGLQRKIDTPIPIRKVMEQLSVAHSYIPGNVSAQWDGWEACLVSEGVHFPVRGLLLVFFFALLYPPPHSTSTSLVAHKMRTSIRHQTTSIFARQ